MQAASLTSKIGPLLAGLVGRTGNDARRGALFAFAIRVGSAGLAFGSQILLARWMGVHEFGLFTFCVVLMSVLGVLASSGLPWSYVRFLYEYSARGDWDRFRGFLGSARTASVWTGVICLVGALGIIELAGQRISPELVLPLIIVLACLPVQTLNEFQEGVGKAHGWIGLSLAPAFIVRPVLLLLILGAAKLAGQEITAVTAGLALLATMCCVSLGQFVLQDRRLRTVVEPGPWAFEPSTWLSVSFALLLLEGFATLLLHSDILVLKAFVSADQISIYYAAVRTITLTGFVYFAIAAVFGARFSRMHALGDTAGLHDVYRQATQLTFWPSLVLALGVLALGKPLLWLFGPEFVEGYPLMFLIGAGLLARAAVGPMQILLSMCGWQKQCA
ncbi:MAG: oligosaccharide flippase family protein, partial [Pseudomonadota bacterium]